MIYRLLAINIDGTLLQSNGRIQRSTREAVEYVQSKGIYVTLVTSRSFPSAKKVAKALKLDSYLVTHRGAYIASSLEQPLLVKRISEDITFELVRLLEAFHCQIRLVDDRYSLANRSRVSNNLLAKTVFSSGDPVFYSQQFVESLSDAISEEPCSPPKIEIFFERKEDLQDAKQAIYTMYDEIDTLQLDDLRLEIVPKGASKLTGLLYLGERLGVKRGEMVVIADAYDDIDMIEKVGLGVAMGNAPVEVKKAADWVTRSNNENGVGYVVKEHFRKQQPIEFLKKMNIIK